VLRDFYRQLGWLQVIDDEDFAAFELRALLALFPWRSLPRMATPSLSPATEGSASPSA
jgi:hypothetical protein